MLVIYIHTVACRRRPEDPNLSSASWNTWHRHTDAVTHPSIDYHYHHISIINIINMTSVVLALQKNKAFGVIQFISDYRLLQQLYPFNGLFSQDNLDKPAPEK